MACVVLVVPLYLAAEWLGALAITLLLGTAYAPIGDMLGACLVMVLAVVMPNGFWQLLVLRGKTWIGGLAGILAVAGLVLTITPLVAAFGVVGAAYSGIIAATLRALVLVAAGLAFRPQKST